MSQRLLNDCHMVQNVMTALSHNGAISTVDGSNSRSIVAAGGFQVPVRKRRLLLRIPRPHRL